jgi:hypothetical protein
MFYKIKIIFIKFPNQNSEVKISGVLDFVHRLVFYYKVVESNLKQSNFSDIKFSINLPPVPRSTMWYLPLRFSYNVSYRPIQYISFDLILF